MASATSDAVEDALASKAMDKSEPQESSNETCNSQERAPLSCMQYFDRLYYCFSPAHQARSYYRNGTLDNCRAHMRQLRLCMLSRLKHNSAADALYADEEGQQHSKQKVPVWEIRPEFLKRMKAADEAENRTSSNDYASTEWWKI